ncbi:hypothetical protein Shyhy02_19830 [Streptomyces hygroscopicus subsp. hygroscopicus]|nr:hypothetical protein Shyhy02_19830 [Streptomyces hygroscopicus subsp. hygroscopicus]
MIRKTSVPPCFRITFHHLIAERAFPLWNVLNVTPRLLLVRDRGTLTGADPGAPHGLPAFRRAPYPKWPNTGRNVHLFAACREAT